MNLKEKMIGYGAVASAFFLIITLAFYTQRVRPNQFDPIAKGEALILIVGEELRGPFERYAGLRFVGKLRAFCDV